MNDTGCHPGHFRASGTPPEVKLSKERLSSVRTRAEERALAEKRRRSKRSRMLRRNARDILATLGVALAISIFTIHDKYTGMILAGVVLSLLAAFLVVKTAAVINYRWAMNYRSGTQMADDARDRLHRLERVERSIYRIAVTATFTFLLYSLRFMTST